MSSVVLVSRDGLFRAGLASLLRKEGFTVVEVSRVAPAVAAARQQDGGVCVVDLGSDDVHPHTIRRFASDAPQVRLVALGSERSTQDDMLETFRSGGSGYVPPSASGEGLVRAVRTVLDGNLAIPRGAVAALVGELQGGRRRVTIHDRPVALTEREARALELFTRGRTTHEIAAELGISAITVRRHLGAVAAKAEADDVASLRALVAT